MSKILSIIIPVYNQENLIERCIDSIFFGLSRRTEKLVEVICIDDGSTDQSVQKIKKYNSKNNFKLFQQPNSGLGYTRNKAIKMATGKFLLFLDSDDCLNPKNLPKLIELASQSCSDCIDYNVTVFDHNRLTHKGHMFKHKSAKKISLEQYFNRSSSLGITAWSKIWNRKTIIENNITFQENVKFEDIQFARKFYDHAKKIDLINVDVYIYSTGNISITRKSKFSTELAKDIYLVRIKQLKQWRQSTECKNLDSLLAKEIERSKIDILRNMKKVFKGGLPELKGIMYSLKGILS